METTVSGSTQRKRRHYKKSRFGCRNCKLRRVKCDEGKPQCQRCKDYGVLCNFVAQTSDLQILTTGFQSRAVEFLPPSLSLPIFCSDDVTSFMMDTQCIHRLQRFRMRAVNSFSTEMMKIWKYRVPHIAFRNPYLMHTMLTVAAAHERYQAMPTKSYRTRTEAHHFSQCVRLFNEKLSRHIDSSDFDPLWATAALLGIMTIASFDAATPEEAWPLRQSDPSDLEWFRLSEAKKTIWDLTNPLRPGGIFRAMAHEYAGLHFELPLVGTEGIPTTLAEMCNMSASCNKQNNPYFVAAHVLARLQRLTGNESPGIQMVSFMSQSQSSFRDLLQEKDPVALLLLALWYVRASESLWWIEQRARVEYRAICLYLERFHRNNSKIHQLLCSLPDRITRAGYTTDGTGAMI
ncbi:hypothetical protein BGW36DRAFT_368858 [Talaromyces proteolyticus]|uniref:Zn(2)-C6 fungal-type domain-containing protein n=1 Tax=Talaromyces proteolyticus TaxID=1131652 RepID=A0AAD4L2Q2_9EURO|nr:uncharacterized protein BGW36DRAFT_368858 [Talaromyces proteolyticus]KAH8703123.1 hypothetical protein BGW36DRAFT_368858 [Talaromyces proteolyticus]